MPIILAFVYERQPPKMRSFGRKGAGGSTVAWPDDVRPLDERLLQVGQQNVALMQIDAPIPLENSDYSPTQLSFWPNIVADLAGHSSHSIVTTFDGDGSTVEEARSAALAVLRVLQVLAEQPDTLGIYWEASNLAFPRDIFRKIVDPDSGRLPPVLAAHLHLWGTPKPDGEGLGAVTHGLKALCLPELWHEQTGEDKETVISRVYGLAEYMIDSSSTIRDGDTFRSEDGGPAMRVRVAQSDGTDYLQIGFVHDA